MKEIEVKILEVNKQEIINKILQLGGKLLFENKQFHAIYYNSKENETIRIRKEGQVVVLCHKEKIESENGLKSNIETEFETDNFENASKFLEKIGLTKKPNEIKKTRTSYKLGNCKIEFDKIQTNNIQIPEFLEIEAQSEQDLIKCAKSLGFEKSDFKTWNQHKVIEYYLNK